MPSSRRRGRRTRMTLSLSGRELTRLGALMHLTPPGKWLRAIRKRRRRPIRIREEQNTMEIHQVDSMTIMTQEITISDLLIDVKCNNHLLYFH
jgi:hypothetical protein